MKTLSILVAGLLAVAQLGDAAATAAATVVRKEWRTLTKTQQLDYIKAVRCMQTKPSRTNGAWEGAKNRFDDFEGLHIVETDRIHYVVRLAPPLDVIQTETLTAQGHFLPWHRQFIRLWEKDLCSTCNYRGALPYWDWTLDAKDRTGLAKSPLWDPVYGFGGNGPYLADLSGFPAGWVFEGFAVPNRTGGGCVPDGPFANVPVNMGMGRSTAYQPHCLRRDFSGDLFAITGNMKNVRAAVDADSYLKMILLQEQLSMTVPDIKMHGAGHLSVGGQIGDMSNMYSSPGDPIFYLHHANLDRVWASWQKKNFAVRKTEMTGPDTPYAYPFNFFGDVPYKNVTLNTPLYFKPLSSDIIVKDTMDTAALGYVYDKYY
jgi:tyrosinase